MSVKISFLNQKEIDLQQIEELIAFLRRRGGWLECKDFALALKNWISGEFLTPEAAVSAAIKINHP
jgi:hypothetical protein